MYAVWFNMINGKRLEVRLNTEQLEQYMEQIDELKYVRVSWGEITYIFNQEEVNYVEIIAVEEEN